MNLTVNQEQLRSMIIALTTENMLRPDSRVVYQIVDMIEHPDIGPIIRDYAASLYPTKPKPSKFTPTMFTPLQLQIWYILLPNDLRFTSARTIQLAVSIWKTRDINDVRPRIQDEIYRMRQKLEGTPYRIESKINHGYRVIREDK